MADDEDLLLATAGRCIIISKEWQRNGKRHRRRFWIHPILQAHREQGNYAHLIKGVAR